MYIYINAPATCACLSYLCHTRTFLRSSYYEERTGCFFSVQKKKMQILHKRKKGLTRRFLYHSRFVIICLCYERNRKIKNAPSMSCDMCNMYYMSCDSLNNSHYVRFIYELLSSLDNKKKICIISSYMLENYYLI